MTYTSQEHLLYIVLSRAKTQFEGNNCHCHYYYNKQLRNNIYYPGLKFVLHSVIGLLGKQGGYLAIFSLTLASY